MFEVLGSHLLNAIFFIGIGIFITLSVWGIKHDYKEGLFITIPMITALLFLALLFNGVIIIV